MIMSFLLFSHFIWRKSFGKQERLERNFTGINTRIGGEAGKCDEELDIFSFNKILAATNDFSEEKKTWRGGFDIVFEGDLANRDVAIKRLSKNYAQGLREFINESNLIAKLQDTNLGRLWAAVLYGRKRYWSTNTCQIEA